MNQTNQSIKVAAAQSTPSFLNREKTVKKACDLILDAGKNGAKLIVFPKVYIPGYPDWVWVVPNSQAKQLNDLYVELIQNAISISDESTQKLCQAVKKANIHVTIGLHEKKEEILYATIDLNEISASKRMFDATGHYAKPDLFKFFVNRKPNLNIYNQE